MQHQFSQRKPWVLNVGKNELAEASVPLDLFMPVGEEDEIVAIPVSALMKDENCLVVDEGESLKISFPHDGLFAKAVKTWKMKQ